jgi:hypothetical protein
MEMYSEMTQFSVSMNASRFNLTGPFDIDYDSIATFPSNITSPTDEELDQSFVDAFSPPQGMEYLTTLQNLPATNIFSTTSDIQVSMASQTTRLATFDDKSKESTGKKTAILSALGASAFLAVLAGVVCFQKRSEKTIDVRKLFFGTSRSECHETSGKNRMAVKSSTTTYYSRLHTARRKIVSYATVAGDTYTGEGTVWSGTCNISATVSPGEKHQPKTVVLVNENPYLEDDDSSSIGGTSQWTMSNARSDNEDATVEHEVCVDILNVQTLNDDDTYKEDDALNSASDDDEDQVQVFEDPLRQNNSSYDNDDDNDNDNDNDEDYAASSPQQGSFWKKDHPTGQESRLLSPTTNSNGLDKNDFNTSSGLQGSFWKKGATTVHPSCPPSPGESPRFNVNDGETINSTSLRAGDTLQKQMSLHTLTNEGQPSAPSTSNEEYRPLRVSDLIKRFTTDP